MRDFWSMLPFRRLREDETYSYDRANPLPTSDGSTIADDVDRLCDRLDRLDSEGLLGAREVGEDATVALQAAYDAQTDVLEACVASLEEATVVVDAARHLMGVMALRTNGAHPMFLVNENAPKDETALLRHAILSLQAVLEGSELPDMVAVDRVTH